MNTPKTETITTALLCLGLIGVVGFIALLVICPAVFSVLLLVALFWFAMAIGGRP